MNNDTPIKESIVKHLELFAYNFANAKCFGEIVDDVHDVRYRNRCYVPKTEIRAALKELCESATVRSEGSSIWVEKQ
jgi:hypothetical protein